MRTKIPLNTSVYHVPVPFLLHLPRVISSGWWYTPLKNIMEKSKSCSSHHQPDDTFINIPLSTIYPLSIHYLSTIYPLYLHCSSHHQPIMFPTCTTRAHSPSGWLRRPQPGPEGSASQGTQRDSDVAYDDLAWEMT